MDSDDLTAALPLERRLALSYAPGSARAATLALFAFENALETLLRTTREPLLGQLRLAWWRDELVKPAPTRARGEPVLAALATFDDAAGSLQVLVDGYEALLGEAPLSATTFGEFTAARGESCALLAHAVGAAAAADQAREAGMQWALSDLGIRISDPREQAVVQSLADACNWRDVPLPRSLRPLRVLNGLAIRTRGKAPLLARRRDMLTAFRLGLLGI